MTTAFVLINTEGSKVNTVAEALRALNSVSEVHVVAGEYDIIAVIRAAERDGLGKLLTEEIVHIPGVHRTKTLISMQAFSRFDLDSFSS